jgi:hypothetical protein
MGTVLYTKTLMFMIHTRDHGHPHVTVYKGQPDNREAFAKIRLDNFEVLESQHFSSRALAQIIEKVIENQTAWLEEWNATRPG